MRSKAKNAISKKDRNASYQNKLRERAEKFINKNPSAIKEMPSDDVKKLIEDFQIHQIELEMQNEELRRAQLEIETARDKYSDLYDFAPIGYLTFDEMTRIQDVNLTGADMLGAQRNKLLNMTLTSFISPESQDDFYLHCKLLFKTEKGQTCKLKLIKQNGAIFIAKFESMAVADKPGNFRQIRTALSDITERVHIEKALQDAHDEMEKLVEERTAELAKSNVLLRREIAERRRLSYRFLNAQEDERRRISLELHDELGQDLSVLKLQVDSLKRQPSKNQTALKVDIESISGNLSKTIENVRKICHELIPSVLVDLGLAPALRWLIKSLAEHSHIEISLNMTISEDLFSTNQQIVIYRIFQEIFSNIRKHSQATQVSISTERDGSQVVFRIEDNGIGFDIERTKSIPASERGLGLAAIEERVKMLDGNFDIVSRVGAGSRFAFKIPIASSLKKTIL